MRSASQPEATRWRRVCCQAMLAGLLVGALGTDLVDRFPSTKSTPDAAVQTAVRAQQVQRISMDGATWAPPANVFSGMALPTGDDQETFDEVGVPSARFVPAYSDRAPPFSPCSASALRHT